jgi:hypothetical protein
MASADHRRLSTVVDGNRRVVAAPAFSPSACGDVLVTGAHLNQRSPSVSALPKWAQVGNHDELLAQPRLLVRTVTATSDLVAGPMASAASAS